MQKLKKAAFALATGVMVFAPALSVGAAFGTPTPTDGQNAWQNVGQNNVTSSGLQGGSIYNIISVTMRWLLAILGFIAIIGFVIAGILYLTAAGDETQIEKAKSAMLYSIIGVIVALIGYVIVQAVNTWLGGSNSSF